MNFDKPKKMSLQDVVAALNRAQRILSEEDAELFVVAGGQVAGAIGIPAPLASMWLLVSSVIDSVGSEIDRMAKDHPELAEVAEELKANLENPRRPEPPEPTGPVKDRDDLVRRARRAGIVMP